MIDTPYDDVAVGQAWWRSLTLDEEVKASVGRKNAISLFKLPLEQ